MIFPDLAHIVSQSITDWLYEPNHKKFSLMKCMGREGSDQPAYKCLLSKAVCGPVLMKNFCAFYSANIEGSDKPVQVAR